MQELSTSNQRDLSMQGHMSRSILADFTPVSCSPGPASFPFEEDQSLTVPGRNKIPVMHFSPERARTIAIAYAWAIGFWLTLAVVNILQERLSDLIDPDTPAALQMRFSQALLLVSVRYFSFALLTPAVFYLVRRYTVSWE